MNLLIRQDGYEDVILGKLEINANIVFSVFEHRRSYVYYLSRLVMLAYFIIVCGIKKEKLKVYYSSNEGDEFLYYVWVVVSLLCAKVEFLRLKINDREASFEDIDNLSALPSRLDKIYKFIRRFIQCEIIGILNDLGGKSFRLKIPCIELEHDSSENMYMSSVRRVVVLLEPLRSGSVMDLSRWSDSIDFAISGIVEKWGGIQIYVKSHPQQNCLTYNCGEVIEIPKEIDVFRFLNEKDAVIGTFGSVIDIAPAICRTYSVVCRVGVIDSAILNRVRHSGAVII